MNWARRLGAGLSGLATLFFVLDATGKLLKMEAVLRSAQELGWPASAVVPLGAVLLLGAVLYAVPLTSLLGAIYLTAFLGGAVATHYRVGSPLATHVLFGVYVGLVMWAGLALRYPTFFKAVFSGPGSPTAAQPRLLKAGG